MKTETCKLYYSLLDISTKCHRNRSLLFRAIPFQSWCIL